jgi:hypothetical protein
MPNSSFDKKTGCMNELGKLKKSIICIRFSFYMHLNIKPNNTNTLLGFFHTFTLFAGGRNTACASDNDV